MGTRLRHVQRMTETFSKRIENFRERWGVPGSLLKIIAIVSMLIDHTGATVVRALRSYPYFLADPQRAYFIDRLYYYCRRIGRLGFPLFCFLLVEGFTHTRSVKKYASRLFLFALISEYPFDYALHHGQAFLTKQNVYFTLLIGILVLWGVRVYQGRVVLQLITMILGLWVAGALKTDYSYRGVFLIESLYILRFSRLFQCLGGGAYMYYEKMPTPLAFLPAYFYNGKRGRQMKYFYYWFYPAHLMLLGLITYVVLPKML